MFGAPFGACGCCGQNGVESLTKRPIFARRHTASCKLRHCNTLSEMRRPAIAEDFNHGYWVRRFDCWVDASCKERPNVGENAVRQMRIFDRTRQDNPTIIAAMFRLPAASWRAGLFLTHFARTASSSTARIVADTPQRVAASSSGPRVAIAHRFRRLAWWLKPQARGLNSHFAFPLKRKNRSVTDLSAAATDVLRSERS